MSDGLGALQIPDSWGIASASGGGSNGLVRYREGLGHVIDAGLHPHRLIVTRAYERFPPSARESRAVDELEDLLYELLEPGNQALLCIIYTANAKRRWVFYGAATPEFERRVGLAREHVSASGASLEMEDDPSWQMYREFTPQ